MTYSFRPARRSEAKPLIGLYAESGAGKTYSALLLARGFVGPSGKIAMIDTESGRGEAYADILQGGYDVLPLRESFSPENFGAAITAAEQASYQALIIDSASAEWSAAGGVLSMAAQNQERGLKGVIVWQQPKLSHQRNFMLRLLQTPIPLVVVCMRAKYPMMEVKGKGWVRSTELEPDQASDILFEMFVHGWIDRQHNFHGTKYTRPDLKEAIRDNEPITIESGARLAAWARADTTNSPGTTQVDEPAPVEDASAVPTSVGAGAPAIIEEARNMAGKGEKKFAKWYKTRTQSDRAMIAPLGEELRNLMNAAEETTA